MCIQSRNHKSIQFSFSARRRWIRGRRVGRDREWNSNSLVAFGSTKMGKETHTHTHQRKLTRTNGKRQIYNDQWFTASAMWYSIKIEIGRKPKRTPARVFMNSHNNKPNGWGGGEVGVLRVPASLWQQQTNQSYYIQLKLFLRTFLKMAEKEREWAQKTPAKHIPSNSHLCHSAFSAFRVLVAVVLVHWALKGDVPYRIKCVCMNFLLRA